MTPRRAGLALLVIGAVACGRAAAVFLDLPPKQGTPQLSAPPTRVITPDSAPAPRDTVRPALEATLDPESARRVLPKDRAGNIDWVAALRDSIIRPRAGLPNAPPPPNASAFRYDFLYEGAELWFDAAFPHSTHVQWLSCETCHPRIFPYRGKRPSMEEINQGQACGRCHGRVAFPAEACWRCHPVLPPPDATPDSTAAVLLGDLVLARRPDTSQATAAFPPARFPHWVHRVRYRCTACHPGLFQTQAGADTLDMAGMRSGRACGQCHDGTAAFPLLECDRCHVAPPAAEPRR